MAAIAAEELGTSKRALLPLAGGAGGGGGGGGGGLTPPLLPARAGANGGGGGGGGGMFVAGFMAGTSIHLCASGFGINVQSFENPLGFQKLSRSAAGLVRNIHLHKTLVIAFVPCAFCVFHFIG
jgi:hypothetical protein